MNVEQILSIPLPGKDGDPTLSYPHVRDRRASVVDMLLRKLREQGVDLDSEATQEVGDRLGLQRSCWSSARMTSVRDASAPFGFRYRVETVATAVAIYSLQNNWMFSPAAKPHYLP